MIDLSEIVERIERRLEVFRLLPFLGGATALALLGGMSYYSFYTQGFYDGAEAARQAKDSILGPDPKPFSFDGGIAFFSIVAFGFFITILPVISTLLKGPAKKSLPLVQEPPKELPSQQGIDIKPSEERQPPKSRVSKPKR